MIEWHTGDPPAEGNYLVWCGWANGGSWLARKNAARPMGDYFWYDEPAGINPIFHVTHWAYINPPEGTT